MKKFTTHHELKEALLKDPAFRAAYEAECQNPEPDYQIIRHHNDSTEEVVFDSALQNKQTNELTNKLTTNDSTGNASSCPSLPWFA